MLRADRGYGLLHDRREAQENAARLKRLANLRANPRAALVVDRYDEDWSRLGWVMVQGAAEILLAGAEHDRAQAALRARYPQLAGMEIAALPVVAVRIDHAASWGRLEIPRPCPDRRIRYCRPDQEEFAVSQADVVERAVAVIGEGRDDDYILAPARQAAALADKAPALGRLLHTAKIETYTRQYERHDRAAGDAQTRFKTAMKRANGAVFADRGAGRFDHGRRASWAGSISAS